MAENVGKAYVEIRADGTHFEQDIKDIIAKVEATSKVNLAASIDLEKVKADLDKITADHPVKLSATIDLAPVRADLDKLRADQEANAIKIRAEADTSKASEDIRKVSEDTKTSPVEIHAVADTTTIASSVAKAVESINSSPTSKPVLKPKVDAKEAESEASKLDLKAILTLLPKIPDNVKSGLTGLAYSITGAIPIASYVEAISDLGKNFEKMGLQYTAMAARYVNYANAASDAAMATLSLGGDLSNLIGFAALGPAVFTAYGSAMLVLKDSFSKFTQAMNGSKTALATFPADVQKIIGQLSTLNKDFSMPIKSAFWDNVGNTLIKISKEDLPTVRDAFTQTAKQLGNGFDAALASFDAWVKSGNFKTAFDNINQGWANAVKGVRPFSDALNTLTTVGSQFFVGFGTDVANAAAKFKNFIDTAAKSGDIVAWIDSAKSTFKQVWDLAGNLVSIFQSLTDAADKAGAGGLTLLSNAVAKVADGLKTVAAQKQVTAFLTDVHTGAENLFAGLMNLLGVLGKVSGGLGDVMHAAGSAGGAILTALSGAFDGTRLTSGVADALNGLRDIAEGLKPAFHNAGNAIGDLGTMAGTMLQSTISGIARMVGTVASVIANLRDGFVAVIPIFNKFMQGLVDVAAGPVIALAKTIGDLLVAFSKLPEPLQNVIMMLGLFAFTIPKVLSWFDDFKTKLSKIFKGVSDDAKKSSDDTNKALSDTTGTDKAVKNAQGFRDQVKASTKDVASSLVNDVEPAWAKVGQSVKDVGVSTASAVKGTFTDISTAAGILATDVQTSLVNMGTGIGKAMTPAVNATKQAFVDMGGSFKEVGALAASKFQEGFANLGSGAAGIFAPVINAAQKAKDAIVAPFKDIAQNVKDSTEGIPVGVKADFDDVVTEVTGVRDEITRQGTTMWDSFKTSASEMTTAVGGTFVKLGTTIAESVPAQKVAAAFGEIKAVGIATADSITERFLVVQGTLSDLGKNIGGAASATAGGLGQIAKSGASVAKSGLSAALSGVMGIMGGPWGLALAAGSAAIETFMQSQADAAQKVDDFATSLNQNTGAVTDATKKLIPKDALDGATNGWDNFVRGFLQDSKSTEESLNTLGISTQDYTNKLADPNGRDDFVKGIQAISDAQLAGLPVTDQMAQAIGTTTDKLKNINSDSMEHLAIKAGDTAKALDEAQKQVVALAQATGTSNVQAAEMQKNFQTLGDVASTSSDKFSALKDNLQMIIDANDKASTQIVNANTGAVTAINNGVHTTVNAQRDMAQANLDLASSLSNVSKENGGLVSNLYDVKTGFDFTKQAGIDLSKTLDGQRDSILKLGTDALQQALNDGKTGTDAQKAALDAMSAPIGSLQKQLKDLGFAQPQIDGIIKSLGLMPKDLTTAIGVTGADQAQKDIIRTQIAAQAYASGNWDAVLAALPDGAKAAIEQTTGMAGAFKNGDYKAILGALDQTKGGKEAALASILGVTDGNYQAAIQSLDLTDVKGIPDAKATLGNFTSVEWFAHLKSLYDATGDPAVEAQLEELTKPRTVTIYTQTVGGAGAGAAIYDNASSAGGGNGAKASANGNIFFGNAMPKFFANGGFENHVAQIAIPGVTPRVWAEAETGGEAYIPLAMDKRMRSTQILEQVAEMFGYQLMKMMPSSFADGGFFTQPRPSALSTMSASTASTATRTTPSAFGTGASVNVNVYPSQGLSEQQIGQSAASELFWQLMNRPGLRAQ